MVVKERPRLRVGSGTVIEENAILGEMHPGWKAPTIIGSDCCVRRFSLIFTDTEVGDHTMTGVGVVIQYDVLTGAVSKLPCQDATDFTTVGTGGLRNVAMLGGNVAIVYVNGTTGVLQYQTSAFGAIKYQPSGWLAGSHVDFATPGIVKRFRRLEVHHAPLNAGESIFIECFVDQDPLSFNTGLAPIPATQSGGTNSTVGSTTTALILGGDTVGKTLYFALKLTAGKFKPPIARTIYCLPFSR